MAAFKKRCALCVFFITVLAILSCLSNVFNGKRLSGRRLYDDTVSLRVTTLLKPITPRFTSWMKECPGLISGKADDISNAKNNLSQNNIPDADYINRTNNCREFLENRRYVMNPLSEEEASFPIAYSILMFKDVSLTERLLRAIYAPQNYYIIHVDPRAKQVVKDAISGIAHCFPNVLVAKNPIRVGWGHISLLQAELTNMRQLLPYKKWKYLINLTGQQFPLWSNRDIVRTLMGLKGANNVEGSAKQGYLLRYRYHTKFAHTWAGGLNNTGIRKGPPPFNLTIIKGSVHILGSRSFVEFALKDERAKKYLDWLGDTWAPDESYFATLNYSPYIRAPGGYQGVPETDATTNPFLAVYVKWMIKPKYGFPPCQGFYVRQVCIHGVGSLQDLAKRRELFVNKFYKDYQPLALDCLEELQWNRTVASASPKYNFHDDYLSTLANHPSTVSPSL